MSPGLPEVTIHPNRNDALDGIHEAHPSLDDAFEVTVDHMEWDLRTPPRAERLSGFSLGPAAAPT